MSYALLKLLTCPSTPGYSQGLSRMYVGFMKHWLHHQYSKGRQGSFPKAAAHTCEPQDGAWRVVGPSSGQAAAAVLLRGAPRLAAAIAVHVAGRARKRRPPAAACMHATHTSPVNTLVLLKTSTRNMLSRV